MNRFISMVKVLWRNLEEAVCVTVFLSMTVLGFANVLVRNLTSYSLASTQELVINGLVLLTIFGAASAAKYGQHLAVTVVYDSIPRSIKRFFVVISTLLICIALLLCSRFTYQLLCNQYESGVVSSSLQIPQWYYTLFLPLGFLLIMIRQVELSIFEIKKMR